MCCCGKPTVNGETGYRWNNPDAEPGRHPVNPPDLQDGDVLLFDEPGRCGGIDSHSYHFRVVKKIGSIYLLVRHGAGDERHRFGWPETVITGLESLDSTGRYWLLCAAYHAISQAARDARFSEHSRWVHAIAEKRVKTHRSRGGCRVEIIPKATEVQLAQ